MLVRTRDLAAQIRHALRNGEIQAWLQPISLNGRPVTVEALARFSGQLGKATVADVINAAERFSLEGAVSEVVLRDAIRLLSQEPHWQGPLAWNVSPHHLTSPGFEDRVDAILGESDFEMDRLVVEVTESAFIDERGCVPILERLRARGASVALDDFGAGWSSIGRLLHIPVDIVKIDRSVIAELPSRRGCEVVRSILAMASAVEASVVAEGVETNAQLDALGRLGDVMIQGYLTGGPTPDPRRALAGDTVGDDHALCRYPNDRELTIELADFATAGLVAGELVVMTLTPAHHEQLQAELATRNAPGAQVTTGSMIVVDAATTLDRILVDGSISAIEFDAVIGTLIRNALAAGQKVRAFGEMGWLLWEQGNTAGALDLEGLCSGLSAAHPFTCWCGYPAAMAGGPSDLFAIRAGHGHELWAGSGTSDPRPPAHVERQRLADLHALGLLDRNPDPMFVTLANLARSLFETDYAMVSLIDEDRQWFASEVGLAETEIQRSVSFCSHTIIDEDVFVVPDARRDRRFRHNPMVTGEPHIVSYAGAPIHAPSGSRIGALCVAGASPRRFSESERRQLIELASLVDGVIERRAAAAAAVTASPVLEAVGAML